MVTSHFIGLKHENYYELIEWALTMLKNQCGKIIQYPIKLLRDKLPITLCKCRVKVYVFAYVPCGRLSTLAPWLSAHVWMLQWRLSVYHMRLVWAFSCGYISSRHISTCTCTKLHWWGVNAETCACMQMVYISTTMVYIAYYLI
jgi:hypothetical protein